MPSTKKRINLTVSEEIYERIIQYKNENGLFNDASTCLQLIVKQLNAHDFNKQFDAVCKNFTVDQLQALSMEGIKFVKTATEKSTG